jgi:hypothetical protein
MLPYPRDCIHIELLLSSTLLAIPSFGEPKSRSIQGIYFRTFHDKSISSCLMGQKPTIVYGPCTRMEKVLSS